MSISSSRTSGRGKRRSNCRPLRSYSNAISMFCSYVSDGRYGWVAFCEKQFGDVSSQICFEWNTPRRTTDDAVPRKRRAFRKPELQHLFDVVDDFVDEQHRNGVLGETLRVPQSAGLLIGDRPPTLPLPVLAVLRHCDELACGAGRLK